MSNNPISICSLPAGFIVLLSYCLFCSFHRFSFYCVAAVLPRLCNTPGCLLLVEKNFGSQLFWIHSILMILKNILIARIVVQSNHAHCCVSEAKQLSRKGHRHHSSFSRKVLKVHIYLHCFEWSFSPYCNFWNTDDQQLLISPFTFCFLSGAIFLAIQLLGAWEHRLW